MEVPALYQGKVLARRHLVVGIGKSTAKFWSDRILESEGIGNAVSFLDDHVLIDSIVSRYFALSVSGFKKRHEFPEGDRINNAKIAALMVKRCLTDGSWRLFKIHDRLATPDRQKLINGTYLYRLFLATIEATPESIKLAIPNNEQRTLLERDVRLCLTREYDVSEEWLAVAAMTFSIHYGTPRDAIA